MTPKAKNNADRKAQERRLKNGLIALLAIIVVVLAFSLVQTLRHRRAANMGEVTINHTTFDVEIADTDQSRTLGLMYRKSLPEKTGMLFLFDKPGIYPFWMRNTLISLDIIFISPDHRILNICTMPPETDENCSPAGETLYVLELAAGEAKRYHLEAGQTVDIQIR
jgi:uncharacterized membrane protein (UPF0127 family)